MTRITTGRRLKPQKNRRRRAWPLEVFFAIAGGLEEVVEEGGRWWWWLMVSLRGARRAGNRFHRIVGVIDRVAFWLLWDRYPILLSSPMNEMWEGCISRGTYRGLVRTTLVQPSVSLSWNYFSRWRPPLSSSLHANLPPSVPRF